MCQKRPFKTFLVTMNYFVYNSGQGKKEDLIMRLKIAFCDDEIVEIKKIKNYLELFQVKTEVEMVVEYFNSGEILLQKYAREKDPFDIVVLDMEMPSMSGIEVAQEIRKKGGRNVLIMFLTSYPKYMHQSFNVQAFQYLLKPIAYDALCNELTKAFEYIREDDRSIVLPNTENVEIVFRLRDIYCIDKEKGASIMKVSMIQGESEVRGNINEIEEKLIENHFIRVSRSCIVNMSHIVLFKKDMIQLEGGKMVQMSRRKIKEVKESFARYAVIGGMR